MRIAHSPSQPNFSFDYLRPKKSRDPLDFSIPLRFADGVPKPPGSNYSYRIVVPKTADEDLSWMIKDVGEEHMVVYEVDNPNAKYTVPQNKGREAMVYLTYMIDHYNDLPDSSIFIHAHRHAWHNNLLQGQDASEMLKRLNHERVARMGYMNLRCHHEPGCPDWIHMDRPGGDFDFFRKPEEIHWRRHIWEEIHPGAPIPPSLSGVCCAQFAVSRDRIRQVPIQRFQHYRNWLMTTPIPDQYSGRVLEYIWHYIFTGHEVYCPAQNSCYCDGYGVCFGGLANYDEYWDRQAKRDKQFEELEKYNKEDEEAKETGKEVERTKKEKMRIEDLKKEIEEADIWLGEKRDEAFKRGESEEEREKETESWDSTHIMDFMPEGERF
ncbi:hypothetical protein K458DRAFT_415142 [Lentithecium fluviatile CBS 122367]|uniref:Uncharacterized protein n=1 Tax=Lentithecium fluviatile CBS 122367 TaxID=1168545 RepID=A0A6G1JCB2_9PLEO|nr:hypothetical protein K458DRAFT_415142 [Lentithecium fluviatile CBS 122367]